MPASARPPPLSRGDVVAHLRADLVVSRGSSPGVFELKDPRSGKWLVLYDFELSVARMLDGRRTVREVIEVGERLGIPIDPDGLSKFQQVLRTSQFLAAPGTRSPPSASGPWATRRTWDDRTRDRFRSGVKLMRSGRPDEAAARFGEILASDPQNPEAHEMLALIAAGHGLAARPIGEVFERQAHLAGRARRFPVAMAALAVLLAGAAGGAAWALLGIGRSNQRLVPPASARVERGSPWGGSGAAASTATEPPASRRDALAAPLPPAAPALAPRPTLPVERRWHPALAEVRAPAAGVVAWKAPLPLRVAHGEKLGEVRAAPGAEPGPEERRRLDELEKLAASDPVYQEFLERERAAVAGGRTHPAIEVTAPAVGQLTPVVRDEGRVAAGDVVGRILDPGSWRVRVLVRGAPAGRGTACEIAGDGDADLAPCQVVEATPSGGATAVTVAVSSPGAPWLEFARAPYVRLGHDEAGTAVPREAP